MGKAGIGMLPAEKDMYIIVTSAYVDEIQEFESFEAASEYANKLAVQLFIKNDFSTRIIIAKVEADRRSLNIPPCFLCSSEMEIAKDDYNNIYLFCKCGLKLTSRKGESLENLLFRWQEGVEKGGKSCMSSN